MAKNKLDDLRDHLFEVMERLKDEDEKEVKFMTLERAKAISDVAQVIVNSAKVEADLLKHVGGRASNFFNNVIAIEGKTEQRKEIN